ncbi:BLUF domain-containing protein [Methylobacterium durans]|uniref:BLUF domain-containing protein n=1 Tax=Methylobacterium durans TaxID=2202825 RepID=UPI001F481B94|nr:BLUF domain-containing protein [Methylobacterium durans]
MGNVLRGRRHTWVEVLLNDDIKRRRFPSWTPAYSGASVFLDGLIRALTGRGALGRIHSTCAA